ncbi:MAG TPA: PilZ domain-containing protein [Polyangiaceae bacterium]|nr:PilZ domain-containing protein [Polyangiaceae bacterium]
MSAPAKQARALLAAALSHLQGAGAAAELRPCAELVARTMGLLHQMERQSTASSKTAAEQVLILLREALSALQMTSKSQPAATQAIQSVAAALGIVHGLAHDEQRPARSARGARPAVGVPTLNFEPGPKAPKQRPAAPNAGGTLLGGVQLKRRETPVASAGEPAVTLEQPAAAAWPATQRRKPAARKSVRPSQDGPFSIEASLGAHSSSNLYRGLGGGSVLEAGGIFVATHRIPPIGKPVTLHVHLPGGYEFQAHGVVAWTRESSATVSEGLDAPPGFGARFTEISSQGRELINRYAANREPLFHDS